MLTIDDVAPSWVDAPVLSAEEAQVLLEVFWQLLTGRLVPASDLC